GAGQRLLDRLLGRVRGAEPVDGHQLKAGSEALELLHEPVALRTELTRIGCHAVALGPTIGTRWRGRDTPGTGHQTSASADRGARRSRAFEAKVAPGALQHHRPCDTASITLD